VLENNSKIQKIQKYKNTNNVMINNNKLSANKEVLNQRSYIQQQSFKVNKVEGKKIIASPTSSNIIVPKARPFRPVNDIVLTKPAIGSKESSVKIEEIKMVNRSNRLITIKRRQEEGKYITAYHMQN
jgi:hypothetical protein